MSHKNILQEYCQLYKIPLPDYDTHKESGSAHQPIFRSRCKVSTRPQLQQQIDLIYFEGQSWF